MEKPAASLTILVILPTEGLELAGGSRYRGDREIKSHSRGLLVSIAGLLMVGLLLAACCPAASVAHTDTIDKGEYSGLRTREQLTIESQAEWEELWGKHVSIRIPAPNPPEVDFSQEVVIAVFSGEKASGGYSTEIGEIMITEDEITVYFREISPKPGQPVTEALAQPFHIIKTERIDALPVVFLKRD